MQGKNNRNINNSIHFFNFLLFFIVMTLLVYAIFSYAPLFVNYRHIVVQDNAMQPLFYKNDIVAINTKVNKLYVDEIVAFYVREDGCCKLKIRCIIEVNRELYETKVKVRALNESLEETSEEYISEHSIIGKYVFCMPILSKFLLFLSSNIGKHLIIFNAILIYGFVLKIRERG